MKTSAAILIEQNKPLIIDQVSLPSLQPGQVLVEMKYSGICHTQLLECKGKKGADPYLPHLLGHEGSGIALEVGENVKKVKKGDHVICSWMKGSGENIFSTIYDWNGKKVNAGAITTFQKHAIISENRITKIPESFPLKEAALIGCAAATGVGVIFNTLKPHPGDSIVIFGCGGIGLCAIRGASIAGCLPIIAVDINNNKKEAAMQMGATHFLDSSKEGFQEELKTLGPIDYAVEASGNTMAMDQALASVRNQGGTAVIVGNASHEKRLAINPLQFNLGKKLLGTWGGDNQPDLHFPKYCKMVDHKLLDLSFLMNRSYSLEQINEALEDLSEGKVLRPYIDMSL